MAEGLKALVGNPFDRPLIGSGELAAGMPVIGPVGGSAPRGAGSPEVGGFSVVGPTPSKVGPAGTGCGVDCGDPADGPTG
jgi:hypothetical protein